MWIQSLARTKGRAPRLSYHQVQIWGTGGGRRDEGLKLSAVNIKKGVRHSVSGLLCELRSWLPVLRRKIPTDLKATILSEN